MNTTQSDPLENHRQLCDELYALALAENRLLKASGCAPHGELAGRRRELLGRLDASLAALRQIRPAIRMTTEARLAADHIKARIMQFLHLDRENEQLLLRGSLLRPRGTPAQLLAGAGHLPRVYRQGA